MFSIFSRRLKPSLSHQILSQNTEALSAAAFSAMFCGQLKRMKSLLTSPRGRIALLGLGIFALDQFTKRLVVRHLDYGDDLKVVPGFFRLVHWGNTGAAWSMFRGWNWLLVIVALTAMVVLYLARHHFGARSPVGQVAFGLIFGGILGNLVDRVNFGHVVDFLYFYVIKRGGGEAGFPAFNVADSAICMGVALVFYNSWRNGETAAPPPEPAAGPPSAA
jgi:signal peptidase II